MEDIDYTDSRRENGNFYIKIEYILVIYESALYSGYIGVVPGFYGRLWSFRGECYILSLQPQCCGLEF